MTSYISEYPPAVAFDPAYTEFLQDFYKLSDQPGRHDLYAAQFTQNASLVMASKKAQGTAEIERMRQGMWEKVATRAHDPVKVFPFGPDSNECMLYGTVAFTFKEGGGSTVDWAGHAILTKAEGPVKFAFYQVYLDTGASSSK